MKEAARTSILARRWRFLWLSVPSLDFDASEEVARVPEERWKPVFPEGGGRGKSASEWVDEVINAYHGGKAASNYVEWVDGVINAYRGDSTLRRFRVLFRLDAAFSHKIESWLFFALAKGVEVLELDCLLPFRWESLCEFPQISPAHYYPALRYLKSLILGSLAITCGSLNHLLRVCEFLERLALRDLKCSGRVNVAGPASRLKSIDIFRCCGLESVIISAPTPDLVSFIYSPGCLKEVHLEHAPRLAELLIGQRAAVPTAFSHDFDLISHPLFRYVSHLEALHLDIWSWDKAIHWLARLPELRRLKRLCLSMFSFVADDVYHGRRKLRGMASLINAASCLQHLTLQQVCGLPEELYIRDGFADLNLRHLQVIDMVGFRGREVEWELVLLLVKAAAPSLKKLIIDLREGGVCSHFQKEEIDRWTSHAKELIEKEVPSRVDLVFTGYRILDDMIDS